MKKTLTFAVEIHAPRRLVWQKMLDAEGYKEWTRAFCEESYYTGSWEEGSKIQFLSPSGDGMTAVIAECRPFEYVSIKHLGEINKGVEDTTSEKVRAWAPAYETYEFSETSIGTTVTVHLDTVPEFEQYMLDTFPKALNLLRQMCERDG
jgi:hypothetical protein